MAARTENLLSWLGDAHALEQRAGQMSKAQASRLEQYPELMARIEQRTQGQRELPEGCLERLGEKPSVLKDIAGKRTASGQAPPPSLSLVVSVPFHMSRIITSSDPEASAENSQVSDSLMFGTPKERLDFYRREIQYETNLMADRTNAYLAAQSFLVIAYASSMANANPDWGELFTLVVPALLALLGVVSSLNAWPGIRASAAIIGHWHFKQKQLPRSEPKFGHAYDESPLFSEHESSEERYFKSLRFSLRSPWMFTIFWAGLGTFSVWLQLSSSTKV